MAPLFQQLNVKLAAWLRSVAAGLEPHQPAGESEEGTKSPAADFGPPAHWVERVRGTAPQLLEPDSGSSLASPSRTGAPSPPPVAAVERSDLRANRPVLAALKSWWTTRTARSSVETRQVFPISSSEGKNEAKASYPFIPPVRADHAANYPSAPSPARSSLSKAASPPSSTRPEIRLQPAPSLQSIPGRPASRGQPLRLSPVPLSASRALRSNLSTGSSAPVQDRDLSGRNRVEVPRVAVGPNASAERKPVSSSANLRLASLGQVDRPNAPVPSVSLARPSAPLTPEVRATLPKGRPAVAPVYPALAPKSSPVPLRLPERFAARPAESAARAEESPVAETDRWPALPAREDSDAKESWLAWQREEQHRRRIDVEQRGQLWTV